METLVGRWQWRNITNFGEAKIARRGAQQAKIASACWCKIDSLGTAKFRKESVGRALAVARSSRPALAQSLCPQSKCPRSPRQLASHELPIIGDLMGEGK